MKRFAVEVEFTMSRTIYIDADNKDEAIRLVDGLIKNNPYDYTRRFDNYVWHNVIGVEEEDAK